jgi:hypothetical protein
MGMGYYVNREIIGFSKDTEVIHNSLVVIMISQINNAV